MSDSSQIVRNNSLTLNDSVWTDYEMLSQSPYNCVWRAKSDGQWFVLKSARSDVAGEESRYITLLRREYDLLRRLDCPYIVRAWQWRENGKVGPCIVEEYVSGKPLNEWIERSPSAAQRRRVLDELIEAVRYIHANQIVHGDIKPQNILITDNGNHVKLLDFSMADADAFLVKNIGYSDTFAAPEQKNGQPTDCRTDIYALGKIISLLFPRRFRLIVRRCTNPIPERRYATVTALQSALRRAVIAPRWAGVVALVLTLLLVDFFYMHSYTETLSQSSSARQVLIDSLHNENQHLNQQVDSLRSYVKTNLEPAAGKPLLMTILHNEYQHIANRYIDSIRMIPLEDNDFVNKKLKYDIAWMYEMYYYKEDMKEKYPSFINTIEEDYILNSCYKYYTIPSDKLNR